MLSSNTAANHSASHQCEVIIIGAGITGLVLALRLAQMQISCVVIDSQPEFSTKYNADNAVTTERVVAVTRESEQLLNQLQVWSLIGDEYKSPYLRMQIGSQLDSGRLSLNAAEACQSNLGHIVHNQAIRSALLNTLARQTQVQLWFSETLSQVQPTPEGVVVHLSSGRSLQGNLCVAADGAHSTVRQLLGVNIEQGSYGQSAIVTTVKTEKTHQKTARQNFLKSGPVAFLPLNAPHLNSIVWSADTEVSHELMQLSDAEFRVRLAAAINYDLGAIQSNTPRFQFELVARQNEQYFHQNCVFIGDAAHTIHPLAGQGVNLGLQDVKRLAQLFDKAATQQLPFNQTPLLKEYQRERRSEAKNMLMAMAAIKSAYQDGPWIKNMMRGFVVNRLQKSNWLKQQLILLALGKVE